MNYAYGQDGQRTNKYTHNSETLYFNKMWTLHTDSGNNVYGGQTAKNIYLGETRIVTKLNSGRDPKYQEEYYKQYYYHSDHLGSASLISNYKGEEYQRIEYTPYGEIWVEKTDPNANLNFLPYKFTAKEMDEETGLYYYGARYLDPRYSMWISTDPALGEYIPKAPVNEEAKRYNQNLPGMGGIFNHINGNLYHYAANNPLRYIDPDGNFFEFAKKSAKKIAKYAAKKLTKNAIKTAVKTGLCFIDGPFPVGDAIVVIWTLYDINEAAHDLYESEHSASPSPLLKNGVSSAAGSPAPNGNNDDNDDDKDYYESNPKHNPNSKSPEPKNVEELFEKSEKYSKTPRTRWYKDKSGRLHRFMETEKHKYHWNGSYEGKASQMDGNVQKLYRSLPKGEIDACW